MKTIIGQLEIILYVSDQSRSRRFYAAILGQDPVLDVPGMTEFMLTDSCKLGLMPETGIVKILKDKTPHPGSGNGIPRCELYLHTADIEKSFALAKQVGALVISEIEPRDWGDIVGYVSDPDGHVIAFAKSLG